MSFQTRNTTLAAPAKKAKTASPELVQRLSRAVIELNRNQQKVTNVAIAAKLGRKTFAGYELKAIREVVAANPAPVSNRN